MDIRLAPKAKTCILPQGRQARLGGARLGSLSGPDVDRRRGWPAPGCIRPRGAALPGALAVLHSGSSSLALRSQHAALRDASIPRPSLRPGSSAASGAMASLYGTHEWRADWIACDVASEWLSAFFREAGNQLATKIDATAFHHWLLLFLVAGGLLMLSSWPLGRALRMLPPKEPEAQCLLGHPGLREPPLSTRAACVSRPLSQF